MYTRYSNSPQGNCRSSSRRLAQNLGLDVVAEGVENRAALAALTRLGCSFAQGY